MQGVDRDDRKGSDTVSDLRKQYPGFAGTHKTEKIAKQQFGYLTIEFQNSG